MGSADIILDLVSTGVTLRENNLKQLEGAVIMQSQGALVANRRALLERPVSALIRATPCAVPRRVLCHAVSWWCAVASCRGLCTHNGAPSIVLC
jgi:hypothetical protein